MDDLSFIKSKTPPASDFRRRTALLAPKNAGFSSKMRNPPNIWALLRNPAKYAKMKRQFWEAALNWKNCVKR